MSSLDYLDLCRLCLVKDRVSVPIFDGEGDVRQIFLKIAACLPVKVAREDKLPKKICDDCVYKVELFYQFWNTTANAEKQLLQWLGDVGLEEKQGYVSEVLSSEIMKQEESENRLDVSVMQATGEHTNNMAINMIDEMNLGIPIIMSTDQQITVPISSSNNVQTGQSVPGPSTRSRQNQVTPKSAIHDAEEDTSEDDNSDDDCDADDGLAVKEEGEDATSGNRAIEPTTFVNVALACDEAGPSGLQQQKLVDMPAMGMQQSSEGDSKSGQERRSSIEIIKVKSNATNSINEHKYYPEIRLDIQDTSLELRSSNEDIADKNLSPKKLSRCPFICDICGLNFDFKATIRRHIVGKHSFERPFKCSFCPKDYKYKNNLNEHKLTHQDINKGITHCCAECDYKTKFKSSLKNHYIRKHTDDYNFSCEQCGKRFKMEWGLKFHLSTHDAPEHMCDICGGLYKSKYSLVKHRKSVHLNEYKYRCKFCSNRFLLQKNLDIHMLQHNQSYQCKVCDKIFKSKKHLSNHVAIHTTMRPHKCSICSRGFRTASKRNIHFLTHSSEKPHVCDICNKAFRRHWYMMKHREKHSVHQSLSTKLN